MKDNYLNRFRLNSILLLFSRVISLIEKLLLVPLYLHFWGAGLYGEWIVLSAAIAYVNMLDVGMQMYITNKLTQSYIRGEYDEYNKILQNALALYLLISVSAFVVLSGVVIILPINTFFNLSITSRNACTIILIFLLMRFVFGVPQGLITSLYRTMKKYHKTIILSNIQIISTYFLTALFLISGGKLISIALAQLVPFTLIFIYVQFDLKKNYPEIVLFGTKINWKYAFSFLIPSSYFFLIQVSTLISVQGAVLLVASLFTPMYVTIFTIYRTLINVVAQIVGLFKNAMWPEITILTSNAMHKEVQSIYNIFLKVTLIISISAAIFLHFAGSSIIQMWTLGKIPFEQKILDFFLIYMILQSFCSANFIFGPAINKHEKISICYLVNSLLGLMLAYLLGVNLGFTGILIGLFLGTLVTSGWYIPFETCKILDVKIRRTLISIFIPIVPISLIIWFSALFVSKFKFGELLFLISMGSMIACETIVLFYYFYCSKNEKIFIKSFLINRKKK